MVGSKKILVVVAAAKKNQWFALGQTFGMTHLVSIVILMNCHKRSNKGRLHRERIVFLDYHRCLAASWFSNFVGHNFLLSLI